MQDQNQQVFRKKIPIPLIFLFTMEMNMEILGLLIMIGGLLIPALQMFCWPLFGGWLPLTTEVLFSRILPIEFYIWLQDESTLKQIISYIAEDMSLFVFLETIGMIMVFLGWILETSTNIAAEKYSRLKSDTPYQQSLRKKIPIPLMLLITVGACLFLARSVIVNKLEVAQIENKSRHLDRMAALPDVPDPNVIESVINMLAEKNIDVNDNDITISSVNVDGHPAVNCTITIRTGKVNIIDEIFPMWQPTRPVPDDRPDMDWKEQPIPDDHPDIAKIDNWKLQPLLPEASCSCRMDDLV